MTLVSRRVRPDQWKPIDVEALEENAMDVVRSTDNRCVIAGPGSGKTELLAQRAAYLLQCGIARPPRRILAISYKRDAATNLAVRVRSRCHPDHAYRFDSLTFDAFAKSLVDRFGQALPERWRPRPDYQVVVDATDRTFDNFLRFLTPPPEIGSRADIIAVHTKDFQRRWLFGTPLPEGAPRISNAAEWAADRFWQSWLHEGKSTSLTFPMISRLAGLLVTSNPMVGHALRLTYSHLFMDEFQDTTQAQYDLVKAIFFGSDTVVTAVGDNKQQIMRWALAMDDPFMPFEAEFKAQRTPLIHNYRSSPDLVRIQDVLAKALDARSSTPVSKTKGTVSGDSCAVWDFTTPGTEAARLADFVSKQMAEHKLDPRDFCILVRQKAGDYMKVLEPAFAKLKLPLRNEVELVGNVTLQELLVEDLSEYLVVLLRLFTSVRAGRHWTTCLDLMCTLLGLALDDYAGRAKVVKRLNTFESDFRNTYPAPLSDPADAKEVVQLLIAFIGRANILAASPAYRQGDWFDKVSEAAALHLEASCKSAKNWSEALDEYEGAYSVPLMTVHKSKGLEYHTVIFVGLDDQAWWSFSNDKIEATAGFFVAFTRAKQRVVFSYCAQRGDRSKIAALYQLLTEAGVKTIKIA
ncbi:ATP-dependent helicase [Bradyrhizobium sediminis]|uniref:DNA 3'-5' helicase n=1 Tax=Bradyrhizobium sediminis TaxID=2840469 RepID=A0A975RKX0_9BRAD|nr:ATP-dependent helicase [Bradyrhizobium sediminis]QWG11099.1 ATP-dependent helicase [Bradyrhizobium sediminis]